ncbi:MAG: hypothetical protein JW940_38725 [Polyangiaceae bacterium]|nr:hypothetical protein [Polyangiaceae bacterium]
MHENDRAMDVGLADRLRHDATAERTGNGRAGDDQPGLDWTDEGRARAGCGRSRVAL